MVNTKKITKTNIDTSIVSLLYRYSPNVLIFSIVIGTLAGALYSVIIPFAIQGIESQQASGQTSEQSFFMSEVITNNQTLIFFSLIIVILFAKALSVILVNNIAKSATAELKILIAKKINQMKTDNIENIGFPKLLTILTDDVNHVTGAAIAIPMLVVSSVTIIGMLGYLAVLNLYIFSLVLFSIIFGVFLFKIPVMMSQGLYDKARDLRDVIQEGVRGLVFGAFELKLNKEKSARYLEQEIITPQKQSVRLEKIGDAVIHLAGTSSDLLSFFIIGMIVFILPLYVQLPMTQSFGIVMALLYISGPIVNILALQQHIAMGKVALKRIQTLNKYEEENSINIAPLSADWKTYQAHAVTYRYQHEENKDSFTLRPITLSFVPGQINFIVGGNGSGKSTLSKLLSLHYRTLSGDICFDDVVVNDKNIEHARSQISVIYSDYYLFNKLYTAHTQQDETKIQNYLAILGLTGKTAFIDGRFTTTKLSDGQRRRLALLVALIEDKAIYIFDEWAADQDPEFKRIFYQKILPQMKKDNKLIIVITHDDRYFDCADRVVMMEDGEVVNIQVNKPVINHDSYMDCETESVI